jgi:hypothetical protein
VLGGASRVLDGEVMRDEALTQDNCIDRPN